MIAAAMTNRQAWLILQAINRFRVAMPATTDYDADRREIASIYDTIEERYYASVAELSAPQRLKPAQHAPRGHVPANDNRADDRPADEGTQSVPV
jgi:hypothetical protein